MIGKVLGERYEVIEKIGGGGMALVYKARCRLLNRFVAIKVLRSEFTSDEDFVKKFKRESQAAASLSHPNIVGIYDVGIENDVHYIVMEYIKGQTLKELIKQKGALNHEFATDIAIQIASALENAHSNHIVHRDIKSHNIMLREDRTIKVTDFGIARAVSSCTITNTGNIIGSVHYFSPEQARGGYTDEKSDIYSLGVVLYELVTGRLPFEGETPISVALKHVQEEPIKPRKINKKIPKSLEEIILKCMNKNISGRYSCVSDIIIDLKQSLLMPNGDFVKKSISENTIKMESIKTNGILESNDNNEEIELDKNDNAANIDEIISTDKKEKKINKKITIWAVVSGLVLAFALSGSYFAFKNVFNVDIKPVPDLIGKQEEDAEKELEELGLFMNVAERVHNKDIPEGEIIRQDPKPNQSNKVTNPVTVFVSKGPRKVPVPPIIGKNYDEVDIILESVGLAEGDVSQEYSPYPSGIVIEQKISPGISVDEGTKIDYVISGGPEKFFMKNFVGMNIEDVETELMILDLIRGNVVERPDDEHPKGEVIEQSVSAGTEISKKSVVDFVVSKGVEEKPNEKVYYLSIDLPKNLERMKVTVFKIENDKSVLIYEGTHSSIDSPLKVEINGKGNVLFEVYINNSFHESTSYKF
ncbi:MAG: Stk1 family PASTA domain-containing Ser/Thr kinase [Firmicutes bacterium]|nr:Stk1 family PASTA domain-containing Ser/Thr kinase [Bacillota bacterium]